MSEKTKFELDVSIQTLIKLVLFVVATWIITKSVGIILTVYVSLILASAFRPIVNYANYFKVPKYLSILIIYILVLGALGTLISFIIPPIFSESVNFVRNIPALSEQLARRYSWFEGYLDNDSLRTFVRSLTDTMLGWFSSVSSGVISNAWLITSGLFGGIFDLFLVLTMTFYMLVGESQLIHNVTGLFPAKQRHHVPALINSIQSKLGSWFRGQISLMLIVGFLCYIGFVIVGTPYAIPLAVIAGLLEMVPYIGPIVAAIISFFVVLPSSFLLAVLALLVVFVVQQLENGVIVPMVMKQAVGLDPLFVIISLSVGSRIFGLAGAILAVPLVVTLQIVVQFYQQYEKEQLAYQQRQQTEIHKPDPVDPELSMSSLLKRLRFRLRG